MQFAPELEEPQAFNPSQLWIRMQFAPELEALQAFNPSQLWIRMQFAPELEEPQAFNWFPVVVVVGKRVLIQSSYKSLLVQARQPNQPRERKFIFWFKLS